MSKNVWQLGKEWFEAIAYEQGKDKIKRIEKEISKILGAKIAIEFQCLSKDGELNYKNIWICEMLSKKGVRIYITHTEGFSENIQDWATALNFPCSAVFSLKEIGRETIFVGKNMEKA